MEINIFINDLISFAKYTYIEFKFDITNLKIWFVGDESTLLVGQNIGDGFIKLKGIIMNHLFQYNESDPRFGVYKMSNYY